MLLTPKSDFHGILFSISKKRIFFIYKSIFLVKYNNLYNKLVTKNAALKYKKSIIASKRKIEVDVTFSQSIK